MSLPVSRARKVWRLIQVPLGGVFFYVWGPMKNSISNLDPRGIIYSTLIVVVSLGLVITIELYLERSP